MTKPRICEQCGVELPANAPQGLCPRCLAKMGLNLLPTPVLPAANSPDSLAGSVIGRYKLLEQIGEGGFGVVYMAEQVEPVQRKVALKIIKAGMDTKEVIARFEAERQAIALMDHPNIARALDAGATEAGRPYFVMELVRGIPITDFCDQAKLPTRQRLQLFMKVCQAVQHAHQKGVIHRDIKPTNVLVTLHDGEPVPKVIDFGVAKALGQRLTEKTLFTGFQHMIGTPAYMSPEQAALSGLDIDTRADIYSLGVLLYELLTGVTPFDATTFRNAAMDEIRKMIQENEPPKPSNRLQTLGEKLSEVATSRHTEPAALSRLVRGDLDWIVMKCLEKDRQRRYETASGLAMDLARHLNSEPVVARSPGNIYRLQKLVRRHRVAFSFGLALGLMLIMGTIVSSWYALKATRAEHEQSLLLEKAQVAEAEEARQRIAAEENFIRIELQKAQELLVAGETTTALAYLADVLRRNPANRVAANRLLSALTFRSFSLPCAALQHGNSVRFAQFNPDGQWVVTASDDNSAQIWQVSSGRPLGGPLKHDGPVRHAEFSLAGDTVVTASFDKSARVWSARTGKMLTRPLMHDAEVNCARFSPDGTHIVTASRDRTARVWSVADGQPSTAPLQHKGEVVTAEFSPDGSKVLTASKDHTARVFDAVTGRELVPPLIHNLDTPGEIWTARFSPDGAKIATGSTDQAVRIWDATTGKSLAVIPAFPGIGNYVLSCAFSPDGNHIAASSRDMTARLWDSSALTAPAAVLGHRGFVYSVAFNPDGLRLITGSEDKTARIWDARTGQPLTSPLRHKSEVMSASFSPDNCLAVTASKDNTAVIWEVRPGQMFSQPLRHPRPVASAHFSPDGQQIATACWDGMGRVWNAGGSHLFCTTNVPGGASRGAEFSPDGQLLLTRGLGIPGAFIWDLRTGQRVASLDRGCSSARFSPDGSRVLTMGWGGGCQIWNARSGKLLADAPAPTAQSWAASGHFSSDGKRAVVAWWDSTAIIMDAFTGQHLAKPLKHQAYVASCIFSPDGRRVATASSDNTARVWSAEDGEPVTGLLRHDSGVVSVRFSSDGRRIVTASLDRTARLWDAQTGLPLGQPMKHEAGVTWAEFSPDGSRVATGAKDGTAQVWDGLTGEPLTDPLRHERMVNSVEFSPDGQSLLTCSIDGTARVWEVPPAPTPVPSWFPVLAETLGGQRLGRQGAPENLASAEILPLKEEILRSVSPTAFYGRWAQWFFADRSLRTISPFSQVTMADFVQRRIAENDLASLNQAVNLAPTNGLALARLAIQLLASPSQVTQQLAQVNQLSSRALLLAPDQPEVWLARMRVLEHSGNLNDEFLGQFLTRHPQSLEAWKAKATFLEKTNRLEEACLAYSKTIELSEQNGSLTADQRAGYLLARASLLSRLNRPAEAIADHLKAFNIRPRDPRAGPQLIDLSLAYNVNFARDWEDDSRSPRDGLSLEPGIHTLGGVEFDIRGVVQVFATSGAGRFYPPKVLGMFVGRRCKSFHFLHAAISMVGTPSGSEIGSYIIHYQNGQQKELPLVFGAELTDWFSYPEFKSSRASVAWTGSNARSAHQNAGLQLFHFSCQNPLPEIEVSTIDLVSRCTSAAPFLVALTVE